MGEGNGNGKVRVCSRKATRGAMAVSLCMIQPFIISVFQNLGSGCFFRSAAFFSESGGKFCRIEVRHFFPPKGGSRYALICVLAFVLVNLDVQMFLKGFEFQSHALAACHRG